VPLGLSPSRMQLFVQGEKFNQPIFGCNNISGRVFPVRMSARALLLLLLLNKLLLHGALLFHDPEAQQYPSLGLFAMSFSSIYSIQYFVADRHRFSCSEHKMLCTEASLVMKIMKHLVFPPDPALCRCNLEPCLQHHGPRMTSLSTSWRGVWAPSCRASAACSRGCGQPTQGSLQGLRRQRAADKRARSVCPRRPRTWTPCLWSPRDVHRQRAQRVSRCCALHAERASSTAKLPLRPLASSPQVPRGQLSVPYVLWKVPGHLSYVMCHPSPPFFSLQRPRCSLCVSSPRPWRYMDPDDPTVVYVEQPASFGAQVRRRRGYRTSEADE